jgi:Protein of unknown function (DUF3467)
MADPGQATPPEGMQVSRTFEQPPDAVTAYADFAQVLGTGSEVILQFYETIPDVPGPTGQIQSVRSRLRATIVVSPVHARSIAMLLEQHAGAQAAPPSQETRTTTSRSDSAGYV